MQETYLETVSLWLSDLSSALEIDLKLNNENICTFQIGEDVIAIEVSPDQPMVHIYSPLQPLPQNKDECFVLLSKSLEINAFQALTRGGAIAMSPGGGFLMFCYSMPIEDGDSEKFSSVLEAFYETLPELKSILSENSLEGKNKTFFSQGYVKI